MIASNYRKHPEAMALQLVLQWGHRLLWATARPGVRILRTIRAARAAAFKEAGRIRRPVRPIVPAWWKQAKARARSLANQVKAACLVAWAEVHLATATSTELIGFRTWQELAKDCWMPHSSTPIRKPALTPYLTNARRVRDMKLIEHLADAPEYRAMCKQWTAHEDATSRWGEWAPYWGGEST